eukprot:m.40980 g.40980  ORF g.40980 m.40980 type:complete len:262 (+) comp16812_c0_seq1:89-874(+)
MCDCACDLSRSVVIHTGNIRKCNHLNKTRNPSVNQEIHTSLECTLSCWRKKGHSYAELDNNNELIGHPSLMSPISKSDRPNLEVAVKLFVHPTLTPACVRQAVTSVSKALEVDSLDRLTISLMGWEHETLSPAFLPFWKVCEQLQKDKKIRKLGACDLALPALKELIEKAEAQPDSVQLKVPVAVSPELKQFAKDNNISLLTHRDPADPLPEQEFADLLNSKLDIADPLPWKAQWLLRFSAFDTARSVIEQLGYSIAALKA